MKVSGIRASLAIQDALEKVGLGRTSKMNGGHTAGFIEKNRFGSTGFSLRPRPDGGVDWHLVISGKPHMRYREYADHGDGETYELHEPVNPEVVYGKIRDAFSLLGLAAKEVKYEGHQTMWDDDVEYGVVTAYPEWLGPYSDRNPPTLRQEPTLVATSLKGQPFSGGGNLPAYRLISGSYMFPRESLEVIAAHREWDGAALQTVTFDAKGSVEIIRQATRGRPLSRIQSPRSSVTNFWGDEVEVWHLPAAIFDVHHKFRIDVPALVAGELTTDIGFAKHDAQYGEAPWTEPAATGPRP